MELSTPDGVDRSDDAPPYAVCSRTFSVSKGCSIWTAREGRDGCV
jgi:hypothetical protein